jgi:uncharacterized protein YajQ (UPF0234 family)
MAKDNSFDIVSEVDLAEVENAVNQAMKEVSQRFDFKGTNSRIEFDKGERVLTLSTASEFTLQNLVGVLTQKLVRRKVGLKALEYGTVEPAAKDTVRQKVTLQAGIPIEKAREVVKFIKDLKLKKVQVAIQGEQLRVSGKDRDALQEAIAAVKGHNFDIDMQFTNYR